MPDHGSGHPIVLIPGIQGRWEWMGPAVDALATRGRVVTESLPGDAGSTGRIDPDRGFDSFVDWVDGLLDRAGLASAALCGVSFGGWIALRYAATRPERVTSLTLASTPSPTFRPGCRVEWYLRFPRLLSPLFAATSPLRLYPEIAAALPAWGARAGFGARHLARVIAHPFGPTRMAERMRLAAAVDFAADCRRIAAPTLVVTGEPWLDRVVPVTGTRAYVDLIAGSRYARIDRSGHLGLVTRPDVFADLVSDFARTAGAPRQTSMQVPA